MSSRLRPRCAAVSLALALAAAPVVARAQTREAPVSPAVDQARRKQAAADLHRQGVDVDWRLATWAELRDWEQRASEARGLKEDCGMPVDWRTYSLADLRDWNGRCARAATLARFGIKVDWKAYSTQQLDDLRAFLQQIRAPERGAAAPILPADAPQGFDPDAIITPSYLGPDTRRDARAGAPAAAPHKGARPEHAPPVPTTAVARPVPLPSVAPPAEAEERPRAPAPPPARALPAPAARAPIVAVPTKRAATPKVLGPAAKGHPAPKLGASVAAKGPKPREATLDEPLPSAPAEQLEPMAPAPVVAPKPAKVSAKAAIAIEHPAAATPPPPPSPAAIPAPPARPAPPAVSVAEPRVAALPTDDFDPRPARPAPPASSAKATAPHVVAPQAPASAAKGRNKPHVTSKPAAPPGEAPPVDDPTPPGPKLAAAPAPKPAPTAPTTGPAPKPAPPARPAPPASEPEGFTPPPDNPYRAVRPAPPAPPAEERLEPAKL